MTTMNVSLPEKLKVYVNGPVESGGYGTASEYVRGLIRQDLNSHEKEHNERLNASLFEGLESIEEEGTVEDIDEYWIKL
ncbi:MAG: Antitoxin ParD4 [Armatimonadota bacterium]|jgi:antitoxin ParD1/3/4